MNHSTMLISLRFIIANNTSKDLRDKNMFVSSANNIRFKIEEVEVRSFMNSENNSGPCMGL